MKKKVTIKEMAQILSVSISTISKSLNDSPEISEKTKKRVKELADFYDYVPNHSAVSLKNRSTHTIGVIIPNIQNPFFADVLKNIEIQAKKKDYRIIAFFTGEKLKEEKDSLRILSNGMAEGIIICPSEETFFKKKFDHINEIGESTPMITFDRLHKDLNYNSVSVDDEESVFKACEHLYNNGARHILFASTIGRLSVGKTRRKSFQRYIENHPGAEGEIVEEHNYKNLRDKAEKYILNKVAPCDAVLGADIESTLILNSTILKNKLKYIEDISLIGYVNQRHNRLQYPEISYIDQFAEKIGHHTVETLLNHVNDRNQAIKKNIIKTEVVVKDTSK